MHLFKPESWYWLYDVPPFRLSLLFIAAFVGFYWIGAIIVRPILRQFVKYTAGCNDIVGYVLSCFCVFYGLLLGLIAVTAYQNVSEAGANVTREAAALSALYEDVSRYPEPHSQNLRWLIRDYTRYVIKYAWPLQRRGIVPEEGTIRAAAFYDQLLEFKPATPAEEILHAEALRQFNHFLEARRLRLFSVTSGLPPMIRVHGDVRRINLPPLEHKDVHAMIYDIMNDGQRKFYEENLECDFSFEIPNLARFRVNAFVQNRGAGGVFRTIPSKVLSLEDLKAPKVFVDIANQPRGVVLVTGPTGSGKSTTLAAIINHINENEQGHILTVEDPIEFVHESKKCLINQREVGPHTLSFSNALRSALREDPDIILVGEMRDLETIRLALTAAETGHLVFGTLHTSSAAKTIDRIIDVFPAEEKEMMRAMLSVV